MLYSIQATPASELPFSPSPPDRETKNLSSIGETSICQG